MGIATRDHALNESARVAECLRDLSSMHQHLCPRQVLGVRIGLLAGEVHGLELPRRDKRLYAIVETDGCLADGITVATGCSIGHRTMRLVDHGKTAATFIDTNTGRAFRVRPRNDARERAAAYAPAARTPWYAQRDAYQAMAANELLDVEEVDLAIDLAALISRPGGRAMCFVCGEEIVNKREIERGGAPFCRSCCGDRYYRARA